MEIWRDDLCYWGCSAAVVVREFETRHGNRAPRHGCGFSWVPRSGVEKCPQNVAACAMRTIFCVDRRNYESKVSTELPSSKKYVLVAVLVFGSERDFHELAPFSV